MEKVQFQLESTLPELKDLYDKGLFSKYEIDQITKRRTAFETALIRRVTRKDDFFKYAEYEINLERLRKVRWKKLKYHINTPPPSASTYSLPRRTLYILKRATAKFPGDLAVWLAYVEYAAREGMSKVVAKGINSALQHHPLSPTLYLLQSYHHLHPGEPLPQSIIPSTSTLDLPSQTSEDKPSSAFSLEGTGPARTTLLLGLRMIPGSHILWGEYVKLELGWVEALRRRWRVLGIASKPAAEGADEAFDGDVEALAGGEGAFGPEGEDARRAILSGQLVVHALESALGKVSATGYEKNENGDMVSGIAFREGLLSLLRSYPSPLRSKAQGVVYADLERVAEAGGEAGAQARVLLLSRSLLDREYDPEVRDEGGLVVSGLELVDAYGKIGKEIRSAAKTAGPAFLDEASKWIVARIASDIEGNQDLKRYLIGTAKALTKASLKPSPATLNRYLGLLADTNSTEYSASVREFAGRYPSSSDLQARLVQDLTSGDEDASTVRKACADVVVQVTRSQLDAAAQETVIQLWKFWARWEDKQENSAAQWRRLLRDSLRLGAGIPALHQTLLADYYASQLRAGTAPSKALDTIIKSYQPTPLFFDLAFEALDELNGTQEPLSKLYGSWRAACRTASDRVEAVLVWAQWLVEHAKGRAAHDAVAAVLSEVKGDEAASGELEAGWKETLDEAEREREEAEDEDVDMSGSEEGSESGSEEEDDEEEDGEDEEEGEDDDDEDGESGDLEIEMRRRAGLGLHVAKSDGLGLVPQVNDRAATGAPATPAQELGRVNCPTTKSTTRTLPPSSPRPTATILARNTLRSSGAKVPPPRDLGAELAELAEEWTGPSVFVDSSKGSASSPISIASSPSPPGTPTLAPGTPSRLRVVPRYSPLASTALTPPRHEPAPARALHPFFRRPVAPPPRQPRFVATYSSTSESGSQGDSVFSSQESRDADPPSPTRHTRAGYADEITDEMVRLALAPRRVAPSSIARVEVAEKAVVVPRARVRVVSKPKGADVSFEAAEPTADEVDEVTLDAAAEDAEANPDDAADDPAPTPTLPLFSIKSPIPGHFTRTPNIAYTSDASEADDLVSCLRGDVFGFDMEWPLPGVGPTKIKTLKDGTVRAYREGKFDVKTRRYTWPQGRTAVVQLCDADTVIVYRIPENRRPGPGVAAFLANPDKKKVGVNIRNDGNKFARDFPGVARPEGLVELSAIARRVEGAGYWAGPNLVALAKLSRRYLGRELDKDPRVRSGAWDQVLDAEQLEYAANDVYASLLIHTEMVRRAVAAGLDLDRNLPPPPRAPKPKETGLAPAKASAFDLFCRGDEVPRVAATMGIKETTATWYVAEAAVSAGLENVDAAVRRRLMGYITPDSGLALRWAELLPDLRRSLGEEEVVEEIRESV